LDHCSLERFRFVWNKKICELVRSNQNMTNFNLEEKSKLDKFDWFNLFLIWIMTLLVYKKKKLLKAKIFQIFNTIV
jgi:hypothetical protein